MYVQWWKNLLHNNKLQDYCKGEKFYWAKFLCLTPKAFAVILSQYMIKVPS